MWERIALLIPVAWTKSGRPYRDHRQVLEGIIWRYRAGSPWRNLPTEFGSWRTARTPGPAQ
ncbi:transposase [Gordonia humi]